MKVIVFYMAILIVICSKKEDNFKVVYSIGITLPKDEVTPTDTPKIVEDTLALLTPENLKSLSIPYINEILNHSKMYSVDPELVAGIIKQESQFKHYVRSSKNAIGLMQVIPDRAGQEVNKMLYKKDEPLEDSLLYNPSFNIKIGCAYIYNMEKYYFKGIDNEISKRYCLISGYNTGVGNVIKTFVSEEDMKDVEGYSSLKGYYRFKARMQVAIQKINSMSSMEVREHLENNLPCDETINYLDRVTTYIENWKDTVNQTQVALN